MNKIDENEALKRVLDICKKENYKFNGWCDNKGNDTIFTYATKTNLKLHCNKCGNDWFTTQCYRFINENKRCPKCKDIKNRKNKLKNEDIVIKRIEKACKDKGDTFLYFCDSKGDRTKYIGWSKTKLKICCGRCNEEYIINYCNFVNGNGCKECGIKNIKNKQKLDTHIAFNKIKLSCEKQNIQFNGFCNKDGSKTEYQNNKTHLKLHCNKCGYEWNTTTYDSFISRGVGCKKCYYKELSNKNILDKDLVVRKIQQRCELRNISFIGFCNKEGKQIEYNGAKNTYLSLYCNNCNNEWKTTLLINFLYKNRGCPICNISSLEFDIKTLLTENNIDFKYQKHFDWLGLQSLDFYLPKYNIGIECQGIQHFEINEHFGGEEGFFKCQKRDQNKLKLCEEHNIKIIYYANYDYDFPYEVIVDKNKLIDEIRLENPSKYSIII